MNVEKYIDHTLLKATATKKDIENLCAEANAYHFASVCVNPVYVAYAHELLLGSDVDVCTVIGFPLGASCSSVKAFEVTQAIADGADEVDMVINIGAAKEHDWDLVLKDIQAVVKSANGVLVKVIIETCYLTDEEKVKCCELAMEAGANFVKTSTGFGTGGATKEDVALMKKTVGDKLEVKASGGIRDKKAFMEMVDAGATRIGCSAGVKIIEEFMKEEK